MRYRRRSSLLLGDGVNVEEDRDSLCGVDSRNEFPSMEANSIADRLACEIGEGGRLSKRLLERGKLKSGKGVG